jgi:hypothetical protein
MSNYFYPEPKHPSFDAHSHFKILYEGLKATHEADLEAVEKCFGKC